MTDLDAMRNRISRFFLLLAAVGWGISFVFTFSSWSKGTDLLCNMGAQPIKYQPLLDYWLKMASSVFGCLGLMFFVCFLNPVENRKTIRLLSLLSIFVGVTLAISAWNNGLSYPKHSTFPIDIAFCLSTGFGGLAYRFKAD